MNGPDLDDDDVLDDALRALGTPSAARPAATAAAILAAAGAAPAASPVTGSGGFGLGVVGAALLAGLGAGGVLGFGVAAALFAGQTPGAAGDVVAAGVPPVAAGFQPAAAEIPKEGSAEAPMARASLPETPVGRASVPARPQEAEVLAEAEPAAGKMPAATRAEPAATTVEEEPPIPKPEAREVVSDVGVHHEPVRTLGVGVRVTSGGRAWDGTIDGVAPELAASVGVVAGGGSVRPRLRGDLAFGGVDARATAAGSAMVGLASDVGPARLDVGVAGGLRWIAAKPGAEDPLDDEAGWLVLGAGPSAALVVPRRGGDVFLGGEVLYSWLAFDGAVERVPWFGLTAGVELSPRKSIHGSE